MAKKKIIEGDILLIKYNEKKYLYGRLYVKQVLAIFDIWQDNDTNILDLENIISKKIFCYLPISDSVLKEPDLRVLYNVQLTDVDKAQQPPEYWQDIGDPTNCILLYPDGREVKVTPEKCIGLEKVSSFAFIHVKQRIKKHFDFLS